MKVGIPLLLFYALLGVPLSAQDVDELVMHTAETTEPAQVIPTGWVEVEAGALLDADFRRYTGLGTQLLIGVARGLEFRLGLDARTTYQRALNIRADQVVVGGTWMLRESQRPVAFLGTFGIPIDGESAVAELRLLHARNLTPRVGLGINVGVGVASGTVEPLYALALGTALLPSLEGHAEVYGGHRPVLAAGLAWAPVPLFALSVSAASEMDSAARSIVVKMAYLLPR